MIFRVLCRLGSLFFLGVLLGTGIGDVRAGHALWALLYGIVIGLMLGGYFVEFLLWRKRRRVKARVKAALLDGDNARLLILQ